MYSDNQSTFSVPLYMKSFPRGVGWGGGGGRGSPQVKESAARLIPSHAILYDTWMIWAKTSMFRPEHPK